MNDLPADAAQDHAEDLSPGHGQDAHDETGRPGPGDRPRTGDRAVDDALAAFDRAVGEGTGAHVGAAAEAHRVLQARLTSPPADPPAPGQARPGPPR